MYVMKKPFCCGKKRNLRYQIDQILGANIWATDRSCREYHWRLKPVSKEIKQSYNQALSVDFPYFLSETEDPLDFLSCLKARFSYLFN